MTDIVIPVDPATDSALDEIAAATQRDKAEVAADALAAYARWEQDNIAKIKRGLADIEAGRTVPHDQVLAAADRIIEEAKRRRK